MRSRIYECRVMHQRLSPKRHRFEYRLFMLALDLDELGQVDQRSLLLSINAANVFSVRESDYLPLGEGSPGSAHDVPASLRGRVELLLQRHGVAFRAGTVELVTLPRICGYSFNPVSFYFCRDEHGTPVAAIAEVTNTFGEVKPYVLGPETLRDGAFRLCVPKHFYVSPFSDVDVHFDFTLRAPSERLAVAIDDRAAGERTLASTLNGVARPLDDQRLALCAIKYPLLTLQVIARIHWHALLLWLKRVPWFAKAARAGDQRGLLRPHRSLRNAA